jgi:hypothetical protein
VHVVLPPIVECPLGGGPEASPTSRRPAIGQENTPGGARTVREL